MVKKANVEDYIGKKFNKLTVIGDAGQSGYSRTMCKCLCDCGTEVTRPLCRVKSGETKSCGCIRPKSVQSAKNINKHNHNKSDHRLYNIMHMMKQRCYNPNYTSYSHYGVEG